MYASYFFSGNALIDGVTRRELPAKAKSAIDHNASLKTIKETR